MYMKYLKIFVSGAAAGFGGVTRFLLEASQSYAKGLMYPSDSSNQYYTYITNSLNFAVSIQLPDGNMPTYSQLNFGFN